MNGFFQYNSCHSATTIVGHSSCATVLSFKEILGHPASCGQKPPCTSGSTEKRAVRIVYGYGGNLLRLKIFFRCCKKVYVYYDHRIYFLISWISSLELEMLTNCGFKKLYIFCRSAAFGSQKGWNAAQDIRAENCSFESHHWVLRYKYQ
jgi:hypothetical protein